MYHLLRPLLFKLNSETAHDVSLNSLQRIHQLRLLPGRKIKSPVYSCLGLNFPNRVGLAAGLDKNGDYFEALGQFGFGFVELGTVTPKPQAGNAKPRMFRLPQYQAIINRMGFNNKGVDYLVERLRQRRYTGVVGANIGKNKDTPEDQAGQDYQICLNKLYPYCDYLTVNISSPNTPGLRKLQSRDYFLPLVEQLVEQRVQQTLQHGHRPILIKIAPDLNDEALQTISQICVDSDIDGLIISNTTIERPGIESTRWQQEAGGCSGRPVQQLAQQALKKVRQQVPEDYPLIGVGGIMQAADAAQRIEQGADLIQLYTGFIYQGPKLVRDSIKAISRLRD